MREIKEDILEHSGHNSLSVDMQGADAVLESKVSFQQRLRAHVAIARLDHSIKNLFVLPGIIVPLSVDPALFNLRMIGTVCLAFVAITLVACSNYVINEVLDAPFDRLHPLKCNRPAARGLVNTGVAYGQWLLMMIVGVAIGLSISRAFTWTLLVLWVMGCLYNFPPVRTKDVPYLDVMTESINNPLRMLLGWFAVTTVLVPPVSLLIAYWTIGCYFMGLKRFSELTEIGDRLVAGKYRASFKRYTPESLLVSALFYASTAMLFLGAFIIRYRIELILSFPFVALTMAIYLRLAFEPASAVQNPEKLYREPLLMASFLATALVMCLLLFIRIPQLEKFFMPTLPVVQPSSQVGEPAGSTSIVARARSAMDYWHNQPALAEEFTPDVNARSEGL
jgi:decaprenyl-phosphate phosphoribosyltransferase